jgi:hypothetical protein
VERHTVTEPPRAGQPDHAPMPGAEIVASADDCLAALAVMTPRMQQLVEDAAVLSRRIMAIAERERELAGRETQLVERLSETASLATRLGELEADLVARETRIAEQDRESAELALETAAAMEALRHEQRHAEQTALSLDGRAAELDEREQRFARRWRWLLRSWRLPRIRRADVQLCDLLFLPTMDGYKLLRQDGVGLRRGSRLNLAPEGGSFVVSKIAPWPFDDHWCAYLQQS